MPELPEVETVRRGIAPHVVGRRVRSVVIRQPRLRYPVTPGMTDEVARQRVSSLTRRGKYLLFQFRHGALISHLGMSGSFRIVDQSAPVGKHDHFDLVFGVRRVLRFRDARRFGLLLWCPGDPHRHRLLADLGVEPLSPGFNGECLHRFANGRSVAVKDLIMNPRCVVGIGNIYASEALFRAGIAPGRAARRISPGRYEVLAREIRKVLERAIRKGGTTLKDFVREDGSPGYFSLALDVYGRAGQPCPRCGEPIRKRSISRRSSYYCAFCQR